MTISLPTIISEYLDAFDRGDLDAVVSCFAEDAVVVDEGAEWRGRRAIRNWLETVATRYEHTVEVRGVTPVGTIGGLERHNVRAHLEGNFPGGTVDLTDEFGLRDGRIASLTFVPAEASLPDAL
jgi:SnoaL-like domain